MADSLPTTKYYQALGGINLKASQYEMSTAHFLDLRNVDFDVPNALQQRPGQTYAIGSSNGTSGPINSLFEYVKLDGSSFIVAGSDTAMFYIGNNGLTLLATGFSNGQPTDMLTFVDKMWAANGQTLVSWGGTGAFDPTFCKCRTIPEVTNGSGATAGVFWGASFAYTQAWFFYAYLKQDGTVTAADPYHATPLYTGSPPNPLTPSFIIVNGFTAPPSSGVGYSAINLYGYFKGGTTAFLGDVSTQAGCTLKAEYIPDFLLVATISTGATTTQLNGTNGLNWSALSLTSPHFSGSPFCFGDTYAPKYLEVDNNVMFYAGFSSSPSTVWYSEVGEPANVQAESSFEVRTNDGDKIYATKSYNNQLLVMKENSFHKLVGDNSDNYQLIQISDQYGCISNKSVLQYDQKILWLEKKGILEYNGANHQIISGPIEGIFRRMNISAAKEKACGVHNVYRNQLWWGIPVDGATVNNLTVVYDYLVGAWTFFDGFNAASFATVKGALTKPTAWRGDYSGMIHYFGESFFSDSGHGISTVIRTRYENVGGENQTTLWRRFFLDVATASGVTGAITGKVFSNYDSSTVQSTFTIYQNQFQSRVEMGVPGKAVSVELGRNSASLPLLINGYAWSQRGLRNV